MSTGWTFGASPLIEEEDSSLSLMVSLTASTHVFNIEELSPNSLYPWHILRNIKFDIQFLFREPARTSQCLPWYPQPSPLYPRQSNSNTKSVPEAQKPAQPVLSSIHPAHPKHTQTHHPSPSQSPSLRSAHFQQQSLGRGKGATIISPCEVCELEVWRMQACGSDGPYFMSCETVGRDLVGHDEDAEVDGGGPCKGTHGGGQHAFSNDSHLTTHSFQYL